MEALLAIGASRSEATRGVVQRALATSIVPATNQVPALLLKYYDAKQVLYMYLISQGMDDCHKQTSVVCRV